MKLLVADDDPQLLRALRITLTAKGYEVIEARDGIEAIDLATSENPDLYLLDLGMPGFDGLEVVQAIRGWSDAPILVVSGRTGAGEKVGVLDAGADDYVTKPFSIDELLARIRALTRRVPQQPRTPTVRFGDIRVDLVARSVTDEGGTEPKAIRLTPTEWQVLEVLIKGAGALVTRHALLSHIWGAEPARDTGYLRLYLSQLRKKLEPDPAHPRYLITEPGMGYRLLLDEQ